jgi:hypothetical protein
MYLMDWKWFLFLVVTWGMSKIFENGENSKVSTRNGANSLQIIIEYRKYIREKLLAGKHREKKD